MNHQQAIKATASIVAATIQHMADKENIPAGMLLRFIASGDANTVKRFNAYMSEEKKAAQ